MQGNIRDVGLIPGRSPGGGNGTSLQYSCWKNTMHRGAWWATVHGVANSQTQVTEQYQYTCHTVGNLFGSFLSFLCHEKAFLACHSPICLFLHLFPLLEETYTKNIAKTDVKEHVFVF